MAIIKDVAGTTRTLDSDADGLWHVVLTRFSYRNPAQTFESRRKAADQSVRRIDPLDPQRLELRAGLFELTCAPSLMAQTCQSFDWIIIIDKCLPDHYRQRLVDQVGSRPRTHLHEFSPTDDLTRSAWLTPYTGRRVSHLLTTILDDDDALPSGFVAAMQTYITESRSLPPIMTLGAKSCLLWEAISSPRAPLGYRSSWDIGNGGMVMSAGFSLLSQYPDVDLTVFSIDHVLGDRWHKDGQHHLDFLAEEQNEFQSRAGRFIDRSRAWSESNDTELFVDVSPKAGSVVMTNHFFNDEAWRLFEYRSDRHRVVGNDSFPHVVLKLGSFEARSELFSKRWRTYVAVVQQASSVSQLPYWRQYWRKCGFCVALWMTWRFVFL